ncbi:TetR/AcrR family transcriptional regulator [Oceanirhabdus seepicola]|uniref:TetR/AcrR family transcriptional regulator n=1 Tax=Oceanirhabdus seepicola TaxID=2828781 RepID=A0A9J6NY80_9CLOT|nr:TetR/AcrR family transcriptional regulator [Oceanirhabdus seepicola]MCM1989479.1 TetR/AcrR family transcriptional regulator [Oceanirhabdus seepicola]
MDTKNLTNRQKQAIETKNKIFNVTIDLFNEIDFNEVTIRKICKEANVSIGTFYLYFKSKQEILYEIYKKADEIFKKTDIVSRKDLNSFEKIIELIKIQMNTYETFHFNTNLVKELYIYQLHSENNYFLSEERDFFLQLNLVVEEGQNNQEIRNDLLSKDITWKILKFSRGMIFDWLIHHGNYNYIETNISELSLYLQVFKCN